MGSEEEEGSEKDGDEATRWRNKRKRRVRRGKDDKSFFAKLFRLDLGSK